MIRATSLAAYHTMVDEGRLSPARAKAWEYLLEHGPATKGEVNQRLGRHVGNPSYHRRVDELVKMGLAQFAGVRKCHVSGFDAETFIALIPPDPHAVQPLPMAVSQRPSRTTIKNAIEAIDRCVATANRMSVYPGDDAARVMAWLRRLAGQP